MTSGRVIYVSKCILCICRYNIDDLIVIQFVFPRCPPDQVFDFPQFQQMRFAKSKCVKWNLKGICDSEAIPKWSEKLLSVLSMCNLSYERKHLSGP